MKTSTENSILHKQVEKTFSCKLSGRWQPRIFFSSMSKNELSKDLYKAFNGVLYEC